MDERLKILEKDILELIENKKAKPNKTIKEHTIELLNVLDELLQLGYIKDERIYKLVQKACIYHDIGKVNNEFQDRIQNGYKFNPSKEVVHNILSLYFINSKNFDNEQDYLKVAHSVLNHHDYCNVFEEMREKEELINEILKPFNTQKIKRATQSKLSKVIEDIESIKIKGYLHKCDYSASGENIAEYKNDFLNESLDNLIKTWQKENKDANWNELQNFCIQNKDENIMAIAQTGMGKTEAGLLWIGDTKGFFVLPIRTSINAIYDRVRKNILQNKDIDKRLSILHSNSLEYYLNNLNQDAKYEEIDLLNYHKVGKELSIPINITTMDQIFDFVYKYPIYELKLTTLSYSKIVIDEIQMYGPDLLAYLIYGIENVVKLGGKVAILTATLAPFVKDLLKKNIDFKEAKAFTNHLKRHNLKIIDEKINYEDIYKKYIENKEKDRPNKILVVCNTIKQAQLLYEELKELVDENELYILHSKFIRKDRAKKENQILEFGQTFDKNKKLDKQNCIWISTSIVEASLDIDFDYLFTELQDLNSLFQRLGRVNRKGKKDSSEYNSYVYLQIDSSLLINGKKGFIDKTLYQLSKEAIHKLDGQISEDEKIQLINKYLTTENLKSSDYMRSYRKTYNDIKEIPSYEFDKDEVDLRNILSEEIIPSPVYEKYLEDIKDIELKLKDFNLSKKEVVKLKDEIRNYTLSVPLYDVKNYERAKRSGNAIAYSNIRLSNYEYIKVIECNYDDVGYKNIDFKEVKRNTNFF